MLSLYTAIGYGAVGGLTVEALVTWKRLIAWQDARHSALAARKVAPTLSQYIDPLPDLLVAVSRAALGCGAGWLLRGEMTGVYTAVAVGASAPALLAQLGRAKSPSEALDSRGHERKTDRPTALAGDSGAETAGGD